MPVDPSESIEKEVLYPDDLPGTGLKIREFAFYDADDEGDAEELPDGANHGLWLPVTKVGTDQEMWASSPRALREALVGVEIEAGEAFRVLEVEKGPKDHDPYEVEIEYPYQT